MKNFNELTESKLKSMVNKSAAKGRAKNKENRSFEPVCDHLYLVMSVTYHQLWNSREGDVGGVEYQTWLQVIIDNEVTVEEIDKIARDLINKAIKYPPNKPDFVGHLRSIRAGQDLSVLYQQTLKQIRDLSYNLPVHCNPKAIAAVRETGGLANHIDNQMNGKAEEIFQAWSDVYLNLLKDTAPVKKIKNEKKKRYQASIVDKMMVISMLETNGKTAETRRFAEQFGFNIDVIEKQLALENNGK